VHPWRERLERWLTPLARRAPLSPNAITVVAFLLMLAAAVCLYERWFLTAIPFIAAGGLADALDGIAARVRGCATPFGDFLDHCLDRVADTLVAAAWLLGNGVRVAIVVAAIITVMMNGYIGTQIEATYRERNYDSVGRGEFVLALIVFPIVSSILMRNGWDGWRFAALTVAEWLALLLVAFALLGIVQRFALARRLGRA
jgi:archaetidylinositol phosphate synthase